MILRRTTFALIASLILAGCASTEHEKVEPKVIQRIEYVIKVPPEQLLELPPSVKNIDVDSATQADVARWIIESEQRTRKLENMIIEIGRFFKKQQSDLDSQAKKKNELAGTSGNPEKVKDTTRD